MTSDPAERERLDRLKAALDESLGNIDPATQARLRSARAAAIAQVAHRPAWLFPLGGAVAAGVALAVAIALWPAAVTRVEPVLAIEDLPLLSAPEELELYEQLEFYQWLAGEQRVG